MSPTFHRSCETLTPPLLDVQKTNMINNKFEKIILTISMEHLSFRKDGVLNIMITRFTRK